MVVCNLLCYVEFSTGVDNTRGNLYKLNKTPAKLIMRQNHYVLRCINNLFLFFFLSHN